LQIRYCKAAGRHKDLARLLEAQRLQTILIVGGSEGNEALRRSPQYAEAYEKYGWFRLMLDPPSPRQPKPRKQLQASPRAAHPMRRISKTMESLARKINEPGPKGPGVSDATQSIENQNASKPGTKVPGVSDATQSSEVQNANKAGTKGPGVSDATQSGEIQDARAAHNHGEPNTHELRIVKSRDDVATHPGRRIPAGLCAWR
jgi:hypothetical protein